MNRLGKIVLPYYLFLLFVSCHIRAEAPLLDIGIPEETEQVVVVTTSSWTSPTGELQRFEKSHDRWIAVGSKIPVTVGLNGLAWGRGLHQEITDGPEKIEGDGKSPAGIFSLGVAFGYDSPPPKGVKLSYKQATDRDYFVDDPESQDYNRWVTIPDNVGTDPKSLWRSFERMKRNDHLYELGIVIEHNDDPVVKGKGSAIFFHIWRDPKGSTVGCTAMAKDDLLTIMRWLDPKKHPITIAAPLAKMDAVKMKGS